MSARDLYMKDDIATAARKKRMGHKNVSALAAYFGRHLNDPNIKENLKLNKDPNTVWFSGITKYPDDLGNENNLSQNAFNNWRQPIEDYEVYHNFNNLNISNNIHNIPEFRDTQIQEHNYDDVLTDGEVHEIMQTTISNIKKNLKLNK